jgi:hypothetical protein
MPALREDQCSNKRAGARFYVIKSDAAEAAELAFSEPDLPSRRFRADLFHNNRLLCFHFEPGLTQLLDLRHAECALGIDDGASGGVGHVRFRLRFARRREQCVFSNHEFSFLKSAKGRARAQPSAIASAFRRKTQGALRGLEIFRGAFARTGVTHDFERKLLAFDDGAHAGALNCGNVNEDVSRTAVGLDEAIALVHVKKFHCASIHDDFLSIGHKFFLAAQLGTAIVQDRFWQKDRQDALRRGNKLSNQDRW